jgi:RNA polymerase sigma-70 factor (ECF subfamily)
VVVIVGGKPFSLMGFVVAGGRIIEIDAIADPKRVARLAAAVLQVSHSAAAGRHRTGRRR